MLRFVFDFELRTNKSQVNQFRDSTQREIYRIIRDCSNLRRKVKSGGIRSDDDSLDKSKP